MGDYLTDVFSVTSQSNREIFVQKEMGFVGKTGRIYNDGGTIFVQVAEEDGGAKSQPKIITHSGEVYTFEKADGWKLGHILVSTDSATALSGRLIIR